MSHRVVVQVDFADRAHASSSSSLRALEPPGFSELFMCFELLSISKRSYNAQRNLVRPC